MEDNKGLRAIIAVNNLGFIGLNNGLPWRCKADFKHFKSLTLGGNLLVGYKTFITLPELKDRVVILDQRGVYLLDGLDWCIGGRKTYEKYAPHFTELHISHINDDSLGDTLFPMLTGLRSNVKVFNYHFDL